jgi:hypothetical protein
MEIYGVKLMKGKMIISKNEFVCESIGNKVYLLNLEKQCKIFELNEFAGQILKHIKKKTSFKKLFKTLNAENECISEKELKKFLKKVNGAGFIKITCMTK